MITINDIINKLNEICDYYAIINSGVNAIDKYNLSRNSSKYRIRAYKKVINQLKQLQSINNINTLNISNKMRQKINDIINGKNILQNININANIKRNIKNIKLIASIYGFGLKKSLQLFKHNKSEFNTILSVQSKLAHTHSVLSRDTYINIPSLTHIQKIGIKYYNDLQQPIKRVLVTKYINNIKKLISPIQLQPAGSYYRGFKESNDIDIIIINTSANIISMNNILTLLKPIIIDIISNGKHKAMLLVKLKNDNYVRKLDISIVPENELIFYLLYFGVGVEESIKIRQYAHKQGYKLNEKGLYYLNGKKVIYPFKTTNDILNYIKYK